MEEAWVREVEDGPTTTRVRIVLSSYHIAIYRSCLDKVKYNGNVILVSSKKNTVYKKKKYRENDKNCEKTGIMEELLVKVSVFEYCC